MAVLSYWSYPICCQVYLIGPTLFVLCWILHCAVYNSKWLNSSCDCLKQIILLCVTIVNNPARSIGLWYDNYKHLVGGSNLPLIQHWNRNYPVHWLCLVSLSSLTYTITDLFNQLSIQNTPGYKSLLLVTTLLSLPPPPSRFSLCLIRGIQIGLDFFVRLCICQVDDWWDQ